MRLWWLNSPSSVPVCLFDRFAPSTLDDRKGLAVAESRCFVFRKKKTATAHAFGGCYEVRVVHSAEVAELETVDQNAVQRHQKLRVTFGFVVHAHCD